VRRQLNVRLLLVTLGIVVVVAGAFHAVHLWQVDRHVNSILDYARSAKAEKKTDQSISLYEQYLKAVPANLDVQEELADLLHGTAETPRDRNRVAAMYEGLLLKSAERSKAREKLIENLIHLERYDAAARQLELLLATTSTPAAIEHQRGWCLDADGKHDAAAGALRRSVTIDPQRVNTWLLLAEVLHNRLSRDVEAQQSLDQMVAANPSSATAHLGRHHHLRSQARDADAARDLEIARKLAPDDADVLLAAAQWAQAKGDAAQARQLLASAAAKYPGNETLVKELASLEIRQGRRDAALKVIDDGLKARADSSKGESLSGELQVYRADLLIDAGRVKEAGDVIAALRKDGLPPALPDFLDARLLIRDKKWSDAQVLLSKTRSALASDPYWSARVNALLALCYGQLGDPDRQLASLLDAARTESRWPALSFSLGQASLDADNPQQALVYLKPLIGDPEAPRGTRTLLARAQLRLALQTPEKQRNWKAVETALADAEKFEAGDLDLAILRANVLLAQRKLDGARAVLTREIAIRSSNTNPEDIPAWLALADAESRAGDYERADEILADAKKRFGDRAAVRLGKARLLVERGRTGDREAIKNLANDDAGLSADERGRLHRDLAEVWLRLGDAREARRLLERAAAEMPRDLRSRSLLLDLDLRESNLADARKRLAEMKELEGPAGVQSAHAELYVRAEEALGNPEALRAILAELKSSPLRRGDGRIELVEAKILERLGDIDQSIAKMVDAVNAGQRSPQVLHRLVKLFTERRNYDQLAWVIALMEGRGTLPREAGRASVEAALANNSVEHARQLLGPVNLDFIRDYRELLWLGRTYRAMKDPVAAEQAYRQAVAVAPHAQDAWIELANFLVASGKRTQADELPAQIDARVLGKSYPLVKARVLQALGRLREAEAAYVAALQARPNDFLTLLDAAGFCRYVDQPARAEPLYKKVLAPSSPTPPEIAARARRGLALALSSQSPEKAAAILAGNQQLWNLEDDRVAAFLKGLDAKKRAEAIRDLEGSVSRGALSAEETFLLAQLLDADGQPDAAASRLDGLIRDDRDTPPMLAFYARSLLRQGKSDAAARIVDRLAAREPDSPRTKELHTLVKQ
jgi:predicted Zn-dependent protease